MQQVTLIDPSLFRLILHRLCLQLVERHGDFSRTVLIGIQPRGAILCNRINRLLVEQNPGIKLDTGHLDTTFYRDDFRRQSGLPSTYPTELTVPLEGRRVVLIDDVIYTGRTIRAGLEAIMEYGRPESVELLVLVERRFTRELPMEPTYIGRSVDSYKNQRVRVEWDDLSANDHVILINQ